MVPDQHRKVNGARQSTAEQSAEISRISPLSVYEKAVLFVFLRSG